MIHLLVSYHTCPFEEPGDGLAGGMNVFLRGLLAGLAGRGFSTIVLTRGKGAKVEETRPVPRTRLFHVPCGWTEPPSRESALRSLPAFAAASRDLLADLAIRPDVVSAHYWMSGAAAPGLVGPGRRPSLVFSYHTVEARKVVAGAAPGPLSRERRREEERIAREADRIVFFTEDDRAETERVLPAVRGRGEVIPPGVDGAFRDPPARAKARRALGIREGAFVCLVAARPDPSKGAAEAAGAFRRALPALPSGSVLLVAGQREPPEGATQGARWLGPVPHARMPGLYAAADAVLCPSGYESFGLVQLEALACGVPIVVPTGGYWGARIAAEGGGLAYDPADPDALAAAVRALARDRAARIRMAAQARRIAAPFTWEKCAAGWARLLARAARRGSPR